MKKIKLLLKKCNSAIPFAVGFIVLGLMLLVLPGTSLKTVCLVLGIGVLTRGIIKLASYIKANAEGNPRKRDLISAIFTFFISVILIIHPEKILSVIPIIIGIVIFIYGIVTLAKATQNAKSKVTAAITIVIGLTIFIAPFTFAEIITAIIGAGFITLGIIIIINNKKIKKIKSDIENELLLKDDNSYTEVEYNEIEYTQVNHTNNDITEPDITEVEFKDVE